jgi:hypothetical protein
VKLHEEQAIANKIDEDPHEKWAFGASVVEPIQLYSRNICLTSVHCMWVLPQLA